MVVVARAFLKAISPAASWRRARWFSSFLDQRMRMPRLRFSQEWQASTTQRRARQPGVRAFSLISSPRGADVRRVAVFDRESRASVVVVVAAVEAQPLRLLGRGLGPLDRDRVERRL